MTVQSRPEEAIFEQACERASPQERAKFVEQACAGNVPLKRRVLKLLAAHDASDGPLDAPPPGVNVTLDRSSERPGTVIGPYKLLQQIGEGGMGVVYMAEQSEPIARRVALKIIKPGMDTRQVIARFEAERQALAMMDHANIARVLDGGTTSAGRPYFVMELVHGVPITKYCDDNHLTPRERLELFVPVCQAIQHAHQKGIIHRDIKPSNVMVTLYDGKPVPKVIDFGVAKATEQKLTERTLFTQYGTMVGTFEYMSPEQAEMSALGVDTRSDIYSLGVLLYELLTGSTPLTHKRMKEAAYAEILRMIKEEEAPKPSTRLSDSGEALASISAQRHTEPGKLAKLVRGELDWIALKALDKDRNRRYETAKDFAADVQRYLNDEPVQACPPSIGYRLRKLVRRHRGPVLAVSLVGLALVVGIIGTTWGMLRATDAEADAVAEAGQKEIALREKEIALAAAQKNKRDGDLELLGSYQSQARANRMSGRSGQRFESLDVLKRATDLARALNLPAAKFDELRSAAIASLALPDLHLAGPWNPWPAGAHSIDFDEAHAHYARTDEQGNCTVRRVADDVELHYLPGLESGVPAAPHLSRDGKFLAVYHARPEGRAWIGVALELWSLEGAKARKLWAEKEVRSVAFHRHGQQVALGYNDGAIRLFELPSGQPLGAPLPPDTLTREIAIALHPTQPLVAVCSYFERVVQIRDVGTGKLVSSLATTGTHHVAWHPDGQTLAVAAGEGGLVHLYDRTTRQPYRTIQTGQGGGLNVTFNYTGDRLAVTSWAGSFGLFDVGTGRKLFATVPVRGNCRFSRDDQHLAGAVQDGKLGIWRVGDGRECRTLARQAMPTADFLSLALHRDGRLLAAAMTDGFGLWDLATGSELAFVPMNGELQGVHAVHFEPNGDLLTASFSGVLRWPVRADPLAAVGEAGVKRFLVGPPQRLLPPASYVKQSGKAEVLVACCGAVSVWQPYAGGWILHADRTGEPIQIAKGEDLFHIAVSPDGKWVVTATLAGQAKVWRAADGKFEKKLAELGAIGPQFSPDGRWLCLYGDGGRLFAVDTWEPAASVGWGAFAPDSNLMAVQPTTGVIRLVERATGREFARLEDPDFEALGACFFTADGAQLIGYATGKVKAIRVWDLRLIREHLKSMGLDWKRVELPAPAASKSRESLHVKILADGLADPPLTRDEKAQQAIDLSRRAVAMNPDDAKACNNLAWVYVTAPEALRDVKAALPLAEKAVRLEPGEPMYRNTLGVAYYRAERYGEAVEVLRANLDKQEDAGLAFDLYFLAMSHQRLGETARAGDYYDWAVRWTQAQRGLSADHLDELTLFRAEAEELLGIDSKAN